MTEVKPSRTASCTRSVDCAWSRWTATGTRGEDAGDVDALAPGAPVRGADAVGGVRAQVVDAVGDVEGGVGGDGEDHGYRASVRCPAPQRGPVPRPRATPDPPHPGGRPAAGRAAPGRRRRLPHGRPRPGSRRRPPAAGGPAAVNAAGARPADMAVLDDDGARRVTVTGGAVPAERRA